MLVRSQVCCSLHTGLENGEVVVELTELPYKKAVDITLITCYSQELLSYNEVKLVIEAPFKVCIFYGRWKIFDSIHIVVTAERLTEMIRKMVIKPSVDLESHTIHLECHFIELSCSEICIGT